MYGILCGNQNYSATYVGETVSESQGQSTSETKHQRNLELHSIGGGGCITKVTGHYIDIKDFIILIILSWKKKNSDGTWEVSM